MKVGIVELHVHARSGSGRDVVRGIVRDRGRNAKVRASINAAQRVGCDLVVFPGWTIVARTVPAWLRVLSRDCTLVVECLPPNASRSKADGYHGRTHVIRDGRTILGRVQQVLSTGVEVARKSERLRLVQAIIDPSARRWSIGPQRALLLVCGEVNIVGGGGKARACHRAELDDEGLPEPRLRGPWLVVNPAHTPTPLYAMRQKRAWLSGRRGWLVTTANVFTAPRRSRRTAARAWWKGDDARMLTVVGDPVATGYAVHVLAVP